jgi:hypothetical protein
VSGFERINFGGRKVTLLVEGYVRYISDKEWCKQFAISIPLAVWKQIHNEINKQMKEKER